MYVPCIVRLLLPNCIIDRVTRDRVHKSNLKPETKQRLKDIKDSITVTLALDAAGRLVGSAQPIPDDTLIRTEDINLGWKKTGDGFDQWESSKVVQIRHVISSKFSTVILGEDDIFGKYTCLEKLLGVALRNRLLFPLEDSNIILNNDDEAVDLLNDFGFEQGKRHPVTYTSNFDMISDDSFSRIFFNGMGCVLLTKQEEVSKSELGPFEVDMPLQNFKVRKLYREYGARIHFSQEQKVTGIFDYTQETLYKPGDAGWEDAKLLAKVTAFTLITIREHLAWTHLTISNDVTRESTLNLPPSHPLRRLLTIFTFRATEVNLNAFDVLVPNTSILLRGVGFTYKAMKKLFDFAFTSCDIYMPFELQNFNSAIQKLAMENELPFVTNGVDYYKIVKGFVSSWLKHAGKFSADQCATKFYDGMRRSSLGQKYEIPPFDTKDAMLNLCTTIIFRVTAYHELVGHVIDYVESSVRCGIRLSKAHGSSIDLQALIIQNFVGSATSPRMPALMSDFPNFFGTKGAPSWEIQVWNEFQEQLKIQSKKVKRENKHFTSEFPYFDPSKFECSVSL